MVKFLLWNLSKPFSCKPMDLISIDQANCHLTQIASIYTFQNYIKWSFYLFYFNFLGKINKPYSVGRVLSHLKHFFFFCQNSRLCFMLSVEWMKEISPVKTKPYVASCSVWVYTNFAELEQISWNFQRMFIYFTRIFRNSGRLDIKS